MRASGFYPDFILWIRTGDKQRIVFIEPHGMLRAQPYSQDDKAKLHERLPKLANEISKRSGTTDVELDSFIISQTRYEELHKNYDDGKWNREKIRGKAHPVSGTQ